MIYSFFMYLLAYLEDEYGDISVYLSTKEEVAHMWGVQWVMKPWRMGDEFMWQCKKVRLPCGLLGPERLQPCGLKHHRGGRITEAVCTRRLGNVCKRCKCTCSACHHGDPMSCCAATGPSLAIRYAGLAAERSFPGFGQSASRCRVCWAM